MYEELIKDLRHCATSGEACASCNRKNERHCQDHLHAEAADAIDELSKQVDDYIPKSDAEIIISEVAKPRWIPVTERLPKDNAAVNVVWRNHNPVFYYQHIKDKPQTATGVYYRGKWYWWSAVVQDYLAEYGEWEPDKMDDAIEVTHWMPLPEPPKEVGE